MTGTAMTNSRLIVALDTADVARAAGWAQAVAPHCGLFKLGLEFFLANGAAGVRAIAGRPIFLDLKLHDIPNTVQGAVRAVLPLAPRMLTVHAAGGTAMLAAARQAVEASGAVRPMILAVTVLTSLSAADLAATGVGDAPDAQALRVARLAVDAGADGLVCSPLEVAMLRDALGPRPALVVPGIRPAGSAAGDQARTMTPAAAVAAGADWIVVGRPITAAADPGQAAAAIAAAIR
jgi:orotidine-5'-phosphate decarboxylase